MVSCGLNAARFVTGIKQGEAKMLGFSVTFERVSEESAMRGDCEERGFVIENVSLRDAISLGLEYQDPSYAGFCEADEWPVRSPSWLTFHKWNDGTADYYETGVEESRSLHIPKNVTTASRVRIARLFGCYGVA
jgi:hypothetical protein